MDKDLSCLEQPKKKGRPPGSKNLPKTGAKARGRGKKAKSGGGAAAATPAAANGGAGDDGGDHDGGGVGAPGGEREAHEVSKNDFEIFNFN